VGLLIAVIVVSLILGAVGWLWLSAGDKSTTSPASETSKEVSNEKTASLSSRVSIAVAVALVCALGAVLIRFLMVLVIGSTGKVWLANYIWITYVVVAACWVVYSFLNPSRSR
jgi:hypothetical protein